MLDYYARRAAEYEAIYDKPERQAALAALKAHVARLMEGCDVLEVACGTGYWTAVLAPVCRSVLATDAADEVLAVARAKTYPPGRVAFARADAYDLPHLHRQGAEGSPEGSPDGFTGGFTGGFAGFWWSHVPKERLAGFLEAFHARLAPGARVCFVDNRYVEGSSTPVASSDAQGNTYQQRRLRDGSTHTVLKNFPCDDELREAVRGRPGVEVARFEYYWCLSYYR